MTTAEGTDQATIAAEDEERTGAQAVADALVASGVEMVFGFQGGGVTAPLGPIMASTIESIPVRTELSGAWMSFGYNRIKRRAASVCLFHEVGLLHVAPAIYSAKLDSTPLVVMGVNLASTLDLREPLQEGLELFPSLRPLSKYIRRVVTGDDLPLAIRQSVLSASTGRFGPSVLDLFYQIFHQPATCPVEELEFPAAPGADPAAIARAVDALKAAERPLLIVGAGVHLSGGEEALRQFAETFGIPVVSTTRGGRGIIPDEHPLYGGPLGSYGWTSANELAQQSDLWIAFGTSFSQVTTAAWTLEKPDRVIHVDIDPGEIGKIFQPTVGIVGDAGAVIGQLNAAMESEAEPLRERWADRAVEVAERTDAWRSTYNSRFDGTEVPINQLYLVDVLNEELPEGAIVIPDSGTHASIVLRGKRFDDPITGRVASPRYQSLGAGLPMAIGAKLAAPDRVVVSFHGDGGIYYALSDLATIATYKLKVITIIDNNGCLLANRSGWKMLGLPEELGEFTELPPTDFVGIATSMGLAGERVTDPADLPAAVRRALASDCGYVIDVVTDPETRMKRAIPGVIPILSDRPIHADDVNTTRRQLHYNLSLSGSWPRRR